MTKKSFYRRKRLMFIFSCLGIALLFSLCIFGYIFFQYNNTKQTVDKKMHYPIETIDTGMTKRKIESQKSLNILLLGIDTWENGSGRSDAIMVMRLMPEADQMNIVSIPRDTYVWIKGKKDKVNHAYAFGGPDLSVATIEDFLNIDIDYFIAMNMDGLAELVDTIGTVTVQNDVSWSDGYDDFPKGTISLDGDKTISYVRMRKQDPEGDYGRTARQRQVINALIDKGADPSTVTKLSGLMQVLGQNVKTNMEFTDMQKLLFDYRSTRLHQEQYMLDGEEKMINNIFYILAREASIEKAHQLLTD